MIGDAGGHSTSAIDFEFDSLMDNRFSTNSLQGAGARKQWKNNNTPNRQRFIALS